MTSLGMSGMSEGLHANILAFAQRKSTSTAFYLGSRSALIVSALSSEPLGSSGIFLLAFRWFKAARMTLGFWSLGSEGLEL